MAEPRKIFRIEETAAARLAGGPCRAPSPHPSKVGNGAGDGVQIEAARLARVAHELDAVTAGTAQATQKILAAAEEIDQLANNLSAALKGKIEQGGAEDIQDLVIRIFEACNFQDLIGQRITKVMMALHAVETPVGRAPDEIKGAPRHSNPVQYPHGPRLDCDSGHVTQNEIDAMFGG
jgi:chemotaxis protein CheZ